MYFSSSATVATTTIKAITATAVDMLLKYLKIFV
jgi:hypothetical protein